MRYFFLDTWDVRKRAGQTDGFAYAQIVGDRTLSDLERCPMCRKQISAKRVLAADNLEFRGGAFGDVAFGLSSTFVVSEKFRESWRKSLLDGLTFGDQPLKLSSRYFFAYPQTLTVNFINSPPSSVPQSCEVCGGSEATQMDDLNDLECLHDLDCINPSCMPGWTLINQRFVDFICENSFLNFSFMEGFRREPNRQLTRLAYHKQRLDGDYVLLDVCTV
ncbi:hypothetical protein [Cerasicoccus arenae]|uniref:hypothetical protein n=1 Tax=Cerasicoccus arenae TaxID=424488 RepID=UPI00167BE101|nr:hypothetical protein [Cerasicoccus arenae]MBK1857700.1 hypothetical protein [Cerasicoccus arenae]